MSKTRIVIVYGLIATALVTAGMQLTMAAGVEGGTLGLTLGYLNMLVALSMVFVGVKRYRDEAQGGVIRFWPALALGIGIAGVGCLGYVLSWEIYLYATDGYGFMDEYSAAILDQMAREGATAAQIAATRAELQGYAEAYRNPLARMAMTAMEILPIAVIVPVLSAAVLRNPRFLPAKR